MTDFGKKMSRSQTHKVMAKPLPEETEQSTMISFRQKRKTGIQEHCTELKGAAMEFAGLRGVANFTALPITIHFFIRHSMQASTLATFVDVGGSFS